MYCQGVLEKNMVLFIKKRLHHFGAVVKCLFIIPVLLSIRHTEPELHPLQHQSLQV